MADKNVPVQPISSSIAVSSGTILNKTKKPETLSLSLSLQSPTLLGINTYVRVQPISIGFSVITPRPRGHYKAKGYNVEHRDKNGVLIQYLTPWVETLEWEWNRIGGCGNCRISLAVPYRDVDFSAGDDIQIRSEGTYESKLVYRGYIVTVQPNLTASKQNISLTINGYSELLKSVVVQAAGIEKIYTTKKVYEVVNDIINTFVVVNTDITNGVNYTDTFTIDAIEFKSSAYDALTTLSNLLGDVEWGVDENLKFYWRQESSTLSHKFNVGYDIESFQRTKDFSQLMNKVYFEGGMVAGSPYVTTATASGSIASYYLSESILVNSAITTGTVADAYLTSLLNQYSSPIYKMTFKIPNTTLRFEDTVPMGKISIYDSEYDTSYATRGTWGLLSVGGSGWLWGTTKNGGSGGIWTGGAGLFQQQIEKISYSLSETPGRFNLSISTGGSTNKFATQVKQLEALTTNLRQRG